MVAMGILTATDSPSQKCLEPRTQGAPACTQVLHLFPRVERWQPKSEHMPKWHNQSLVTLVSKSIEPCTKRFLGSIRLSQSQQSSNLQSIPHTIASTLAGHTFFKKRAAATNRLRRSCRLYLLWCELLFGAKFGFVQECPNVHAKWWSTLGQPQFDTAILLCF